MAIRFANKGLGGGYLLKSRRENSLARRRRSSSFPSLYSYRPRRRGLFWKVPSLRCNAFLGLTVRLGFAYTIRYIFMQYFTSLLLYGRQRNESILTNPGIGLTAGYIIYTWFYSLFKVGAINMFSPFVRNWLCVNAGSSFVLCVGIDC